VSKWRRTSWQQLIIAQTNFLEYERTRLCPDDRQNGVSGQRSSACHASDAAKRHLDDARQAAGIPTRQPPAARLANVWSGALVSSAFANLHTAKVVLVDLYAEEDIQAAAPGSSPVCRPACQQTISVGAGRKRCSARKSARCRPVPAARAGLTENTPVSRPSGGRRPLVLKRAAPPATPH
jgi:hypothetical protein